MPGGRVPIRGGMAWGSLSSKIGIKSLKQHRRDNAADLSFRDARNYHKQIREAVNLYRLAHGPRSSPKDSGSQTRTRIINTVTKVKTNAAGVVRTGSEEKWLDRLDDSLSVKANLLADLYYSMIKKGIDIWSLRKKIDNRTLSSNDLGAIGVLAEIDVEAVVPLPSHPDPPLTRLVYELTPIWSQVTGTSPYPRNDRYGDKVSPFADWVAELIDAAGLPQPSINTVPRLVRNQKKTEK